MYYIRKIDLGNRSLFIRSLQRKNDLFGLGLLFDRFFSLLEVSFHARFRVLPVRAAQDGASLRLHILMTHQSVNHGLVLRCLREAL